MVKVSSMEEAVRRFPEFVAEAQALAAGFSPPRMDADKIAILGMGGSAIGGDLVKALAEKLSTTPVLVIRNDEIPNFVDERTAVLVVSYSGNTQETLLSLKAALYKSQGKVIAVTTGGNLRQAALEKIFPHLDIPEGLMPRAALPFTFVPLVLILQKLAGFPDQSLALQEAVSVLTEMRGEIDTPAARMAAMMRGKLPVIYAANPYLAPAAYRWKCQINENAKQPAFSGVFPEMVHNEIVGYTNPLEIHRFFSVVILREADESALVQKRIGFVKSAVLDAGGEVHEIFARGESFLARLLSLCYYGDFVSLHLARENKVDPMPIEIIDRLKGELSHEPNAES